METGARITIDKDVANRIGQQQLFPAAVAEHADQRVIDFHKRAIRHGKENSFLHVLEQLTVALLSLVSVADIAKHVDDFASVLALQLRSADQMRAIENRDRLVGCAGDSTEAAIAAQSFTGHTGQYLHGDSS